VRGWLFRSDAGLYTYPVAGKEHDVSLAMAETAMTVTVDGERALEVGPLGWKFRVSESLNLPCCCRAVRPPRLVLPHGRTPMKRLPW
jgi:hypothetical protein